MKAKLDEALKRKSNRKILKDDCHVTFALMSFAPKIILLQLSFFLHTSSVEYKIY